jgi:hypothetical protein
MKALAFLRDRGSRTRAVVGLLLALSLLSSSGAIVLARDNDGHWGDHGSRRTTNGDLLDLRATRLVSERFRDINQAYAEGYVNFYKCTEQPGVGTMGQHLVNLNYVGDPAINPLRPEALVYEPTRWGGWQLVAVEYVVMKADWQAAFGTSRTPTVLGQDMLFRAAGNRYGLPDFYERHAWLFKFNPDGIFSDWNPNVSCRGTGDNGG